MENDNIFKRRTKQEQRQFLISSVKERICICAMERNLEGLKIQELTPVHSGEHFDFKYISGTSEWMSELKLRTCKVNTFKDNWVEMEKLVQLSTLANFTKSKANFILSFMDGIVIWEVDKIYQKKKVEKQTRPEFRTYPKYSTLKNSGHNIELKEEVVIPLQREWGTIYYFNREAENDLNIKAENWLNKNENKITETWKR